MAGMRLALWDPSARGMLPYARGMLPVLLLLPED